VVAARALAKLNMFATLAFSRGVPMLSHGDELGRSLQGNSNAYCHDTEFNWVYWQLTPCDREFFEFACEVLRIARDYRALRSRQGPRRGLLPDALPSDGLVWLGADGREIFSEKTVDADLSAFAILMRSASPTADPSDVYEKPLLLLVSAGIASQEFALPDLSLPSVWQPLVSTAYPGPHRPVSERFEVAPRSLALLRLA
jgi:isoamylase